MELFREDVTVLGLCAPGGCGKTTLASMLCQDQQVIGKFKNIFFVTVSNSPNLKLIIQKFVEQMDYDVPGFLNDDDALKQYIDLLKGVEIESEPILLVLDDVWKESVVDKLLFKAKGFKMLVTSRTRFKIFDSCYSMKMLDHQDAITLFRHAAFPRDRNETHVQDEDLDKIVRGCKGFPLALVVIARSLHGQSARIWQTTEKQLSKVCFNFDTHRELLDCLATSLHILNDTVRECFLDLGSFPEDQRIPASALVDIWVELYELDDEDDVYFNLLELSNQSLVKLVESTRKDAGEIDGSLNDLFIIQHDLLRDLAIHQSRQQDKVKRLVMDKRKDCIPKSWGGNGHQHLSVQLVSIHTGEKFTSWCDMQLPEVEVLILNFLGKEYTLPPFMRKMGKLKVLIITNPGRSHAKLSDLSALGYLSHLKRLRLEKVLIPSFDEITMPMNNLHKISLVNCEVGQALRNHTFKIHKMFPNLVEIDIDYCNDLVELPLGICDITHLQKLSITNCHHLSALPEEFGRMTNLEVLRLHACTELLALPDSIRGLQKLRFLDISDCLSIERLLEGIGELHGLEKLDMRWCSRVRELPSSSTSLKHLKNVICDAETARLWELNQLFLPRLRITVPKDNIDLNWLGIDL